MHLKRSIGARGVQIGTGVLQDHHNDGTVQLVAHVHDGLVALHALDALAGTGLKKKMKRVDLERMRWIVSVSHYA